MFKKYSFNNMSKHRIEKSAKKQDIFENEKIVVLYDSVINIKEINNKKKIFYQMK